MQEVLMKQLETTVVDKFETKSEYNEYVTYTVIASDGQMWSTGRHHIWEEYQIGNKIWVWKECLLGNINGFSNPMWKLMKGK